MRPAAGLLKRMAALRPYHFSLPYTLVWLIEPMYRGGRGPWIGFVVAWPLFLLLYVGAHASGRVLARLSVWGMVVLGAVYVPSNPVASGIFAFAAAVLAARNIRPAPLWGFVLGVNALLLAEVVAFHLSLWSWIGGGSGAVVLVLYVLADARHRETNLQLRLAQGEVARLARMAERERITRDLHDVLGHTLSLIAMKSEVARKVYAADPAGTLAQVEQIEGISRQALQRVRETIHGYGDVRFAEEVRRVTVALESLGMRVEVAVGSGVLTPLEETVFAMVLQEAATNTMRHAGASVCRIALRFPAQGVELVVADDGSGAASYDGFGLRGMRERLRLLGGGVEVVQEKGTRLEARLPR